MWFYSQSALDDLLCNVENRPISRLVDSLTVGSEPSHSSSLYWIPTAVTTAVLRPVRSFDTHRIFAVINLTFSTVRGVDSKALWIQAFEDSDDDTQAYLKSSLSALQMMSRETVQECMHQLTPCSTTVAASTVSGTHCLSVHVWYSGSGHPPQCIGRNDQSGNLPVRCYW